MLSIYIGLGVYAFSIWVIFEVCTVFKLMVFCHFHIREGKRRSKSDGSDSGEENMSKKDLALQQAMDQITSTFGKGSIMWLGRSVSPKNVPVVSTGSFALDIALGIFGLPKVSSYLLLLWHVSQDWTFLFFLNILVNKLLYLMI